MEKTFAKLIFILLSITTFGADVKPTVDPFISVQLWNTASFKQQSSGITVDNRYSCYFRRLRFGLKGYAYERLRYQLMLTADNLGKDELTSTAFVSTGGAVKIWSAFATYQLFELSQICFISSGYMLPQMSRESVSKPWTMSSFDKQETSCYLRYFATGKNNGISPGINIGGIINTDPVGILYNVSTLNNQYGKSSQGAQYHPLFLGQTILMFGDREFKTYGYTLDANNLKYMRSYSLGASFSYQGACDYFVENYSVSGNVKIQFDGLHLVAEYSEMHRRTTSECLVQAKTFSLRTGYNIRIKSNILEPSVQYSQFYGEESNSEFFTGKDALLDYGLNYWILKKNFKLNAHFMKSEGDGENRSFSVINGLSRGSMLGLGIQFMI